MATSNATTDRLTTAQAAEYLGIRTGTLHAWRCARRYGLPFIRVGRCVRYDRRALDEFMKKHTVGETSPAA